MDGTPAERIREANRRFGEAAVARRCAAQLADGEVDAELLPYLARFEGAAAHVALPVNAYWARVWAARALLYAWHPAAAPAVVRALDDPAWRVREMAA